MEPGDRNAILTHAMVGVHHFVSEVPHMSVRSLYYYGGP